jgi:hypothetical protein
MLLSRPEGRFDENGQKIFAQLKVPTKVIHSGSTMPTEGLFSPPATVVEIPYIKNHQGKTLKKKHQQDTHS